MNLAETINHIYCIGIGGIGLSAIAEILIIKGYQVSGSDIKGSDITKRLDKLGATIYTGHDKDNIQNVDLVVYTAAVSSDNPELKFAKENNIPCMSRAEMLGHIMRAYKNNVAVSGTHGKTTTTSMISLILENSSMDPTILVGGKLDKIGGNVKVGNSPYLVTEACEYVDSFLKLSPRIEVILNIDSDHLDYFKDIDHIVSSFEKFANLVPDDGLIVAYSANAFVKSIINKVSCKVITFGFDSSCDYYAANIKFNSEGMPMFDVVYQNKWLSNVQLSIPGEHNINNSLAAFACCHSLGAPIDKIASTLQCFNGTQRRFDIIGTTSKDIKVVDDYAHHPEEIKATLKACTNVPHKQLWCVFQPHTFTRTKALFNEFIDAFDCADKVIITDIYAAREKNIYKINSSDLVSEIKKSHPNKDICYLSSFDDIKSKVCENALPNDLVITMGAGDIYKVAEMIVED